MWKFAAALLASLSLGVSMGQARTLDLTEMAPVARVLEAMGTVFSNPPGNVDWDIAACQTCVGRTFGPVRLPDDPRLPRVASGPFTAMAIVAPVAPMVRAASVYGGAGGVYRVWSSQSLSLEWPSRPETTISARSILLLSLGAGLMTMMMAVAAAERRNA